METTKFKKGDRVEKKGELGTVVYDSAEIRGVEKVQVLWDGRRADCTKWGSVKGIKKV
jgi:hypothetical protein